jgi:hypothetical protein
MLKGVSVLLGAVQAAFGKTIAGSTGAQTVSTAAGQVQFAAAATSLVVTNPSVTANSLIFCQVASNDATLKSVQAVAAAGSFTITGVAAATATCLVNYQVFY